MDVKLIRTRNSRNNHVAGFVFEVKKHLLMFLMFIIIFSGLLLGNILIKGNQDTYNSVETIFENYISSLSGQTLVHIFTLQLAINLSGVFLNLIFGLCAIGFPIPCISLFIRGLSIGALSSFMYSEFALKGFGYCVLVFFPVQILMCLILLRSGKDSFEMSFSLLKMLTDKKQKTGEITDIRLYLFRYIVLILLTCIISFVSAVLSVYVVKLFNF